MQLESQPRGTVHANKGHLQHTATSSSHLQSTLLVVQAIVCICFTPAVLRSVYHTHIRASRLQSCSVKCLASTFVAAGNFPHIWHWLPPLASIQGEDSSSSSSFKTYSVVFTRMLELDLWSSWSIKEINMTLLFPLWLSVWFFHSKCSVTGAWSVFEPLSIK